MTQELIQRYQPGGDIYQTLAGQYGEFAANKVATAARTGDKPAITDALATIRNGGALETSTTAIFIDQLITDPLAAPLDALDSGVSKLFESSGVKSLLTIAIVGILAFVIISTLKK